MLSLLLFLALPQVGGVSVLPSEEPVGLGRLEIQVLDDSTLDFNDYRGKIVLIDLWATWCGPCRAASPGLERLEARTKQVAVTQ